jgi:hypothetical protein
MSVQMIFVVSPPRSGSTMLERMLESHSQILGGPEPHLLTPLAHLGYWDKVDRAPYDHVLAAESQRLFVDALPRKDADYWAACRAYCDVLYGAYLETGEGKRFCLDKTPAYGLILPFMMKVFPDAKYVVLTRHPLATFASYANSFFDGNYQAALDYNPILNRYVPAIAQFLRQKTVPFIHVQYEQLVSDPETWMDRVYGYVGVPFERETIDYGETAGDQTRKGLGDPIGVKQHSRPSTASLAKWVEELAADPGKRLIMEKVVSQIDPEDLKTYGYPPDGLWKPLEEAGVRPVAVKRRPMSRYRLQRRLIVGLRARAQKQGVFRSLLRKAQLACDVLLRE